MIFLFSSSIIGQFSGTLYYGAPNILSVGIETSGDYVVEVFETEADVVWSNFGPVDLNIAYVTDGEISFEIDPKGLKELLNN